KESSRSAPIDRPSNHMRFGAREWRESCNSERQARKARRWIRHLHCSSLNTTDAHEAMSDDQTRTAACATRKGDEQMCLSVATSHDEMGGGHQFNDEASVVA